MHLSTFPVLRISFRKHLSVASIVFILLALILPALILYSFDGKVFAAWSPAVYIIGGEQHEYSYEGTGAVNITIKCEKKNENEVPTAFKYAILRVPDGIGLNPGPWRIYFTGPLHTTADGALVREHIEYSSDNFTSTGGCYFALHHGTFASWLYTYIEIQPGNELTLSWANPNNKAWKLIAFTTSLVK